MNHAYVADIRKQLDFVTEAAKHFALHPNHNTYTADEISAGCLFAIRWGAANDCVLLFKLDEYFEPTVYGQAIRTESP